MPSAASRSSASDRIRDAALALFGARGFDATSVRDIARIAGVSPALVLHHFGSKDGLREACDAWIVDTVMGRKQDTLERAGQGADLTQTLQGWMSDPYVHRAELDYLARMVVDGGAAGAALFHELVTRTRAMLDAGAEAGQVRVSRDPQVTATIVAAYGLMPLLLETHIARALGAERMDSALIRRLTVPMLELYTDGLYASRAVLDAASAALAGSPETARGPRSDKGAGDPNQDPDPPVARPGDPSTAS